MLVLTRRRNDGVRIGDEIEVTVLDIMGNKVKLGFVAPMDMAVLRSEIEDDNRQLPMDKFDRAVEAARRVVSRQEASDEVVEAIVDAVFETLNL